ncbi:MAG: LTA synthase family protein [Eubacteriales bacterium]|nr:LTA synthase family protein [Eubacteriales bacterium]
MKKFLHWKCNSRIANLAMLILIPIIALCLLEFYTHVPWDLSVPIFLLNMVFYYLLYCLCTFMMGSSSRGYTLATLVPMLFGLVNYFVVAFRSSPIVPWDLYSLKTAVSVAGNYEYKLSPRLLWVILGFLCLLYLGSRTELKCIFRRRGVSSGQEAAEMAEVAAVREAGRSKTHRILLRIAGLILAGLCIFGYTKGIATDEAVKFFGLDTTLFTPNVLYRNNGLTAGFLRNMKYLYVEKPDGYSPAAAQEIAQQLQDGAAKPNAQSDHDRTAQDIEKLPNVIVIMNEAFSDLSVFGDFETDIDYMPFIRSLQENTVKGNCYVSVKGGNTANSEYEFLTGDTMAFLPAGSVPYQQYIKADMPSIATYLNGLGYETHAIHPYLASGWCRDKVYPWLGFDTATFRDEFENPQLIRKYISDNSAFQKIIEQYEQKEAPMFTFEVTMQNHGGYSKDVDGFEEQVHLTDLTNKTTGVRAAEKYLTLILESDRAFEALVHYFEKQEEDTILLMFGDHQPSDYITNTILKLTGQEREGNDEVYFDNYIVPFVMWANFDIEEEQVDAISLNYLSGLLFEKAGIPQTQYQEFLTKLREQFPALTANMVMSADGSRVRYGEADAEESLKTYHILDYNHLSDVSHRLKDFF